LNKDIFATVTCIFARKKNIAQSRKAWFLSTLKIFDCKQWMAFAQGERASGFSEGKNAKSN